ncbi:MAG: hypothetical protein MZV64_17955 [Ignavibacteriales bacterium]|nr:hypothetical protein [Ignavibacteriales bacterium]
MKTAEADLPVPPPRSNVTTLELLLTDLASGDECARGERGRRVGGIGSGGDPRLTESDPLPRIRTPAGGHCAPWRSRLSVGPNGWSRF